ncbi:MAG: DNA polymerase [Planctomycetota bacterium]
MVAREFRSGLTLRLWRDDLRRLSLPPIVFGRDTLFVAYYASAELSCFLALGWPMPERILDLFAEFRCLSNGLPVPCGNGLLGALAYHGMDAIAAAEKDSMRELAQRGGPFTGDEREALLDYCETDVVALSRLLPAMLPKIDLPRALLRGRYMAAAARMEWEGVPIDTETLGRLRADWTTIQDRLVTEVDKDYGVFEGRTFKTERWAKWLTEKGIPWPRLESGALDLSDNTFRQLARQYPEVAPIRELRHTLSQLRLQDLAVGPDGRNRCMLSVFRSRTGRNQPSNSRFIFGPSCWLRGLIKPGAGRAVAYVDWGQQEFGIAAALSDDEVMMEAYRSGDPYLTFAKQAGAVPADATKATHTEERDRFKVCALAVQYGMGPRSLAQSIGQPEVVGRQLLGLHRQTYPNYWRWSEAAVNHAMMRGWLQTVFGWRIHVGAESNSRSLSNYPVQANGADMLRLACCFATEWGIPVCAPVHDALLVEGPARLIDMVVSDTQAAMAEASRLVLDGFELRTDAEIVRWPDRYMDKRGERMWETTMRILTDLRGGQTKRNYSPASSRHLTNE